MTPLALLALLSLPATGELARGPAAPVPSVIIVQSVRGEARIPVYDDRSTGPSVPAAALADAIGGTVSVDVGWAELTVSDRRFRFLLGARLYQVEGSIRPMAGAAAFRRDTLLLPLQFVSEILPRALAQRFRYDPLRGRLVDRATTVVSTAAARLDKRANDPERLPNGLRRGHVVTVDAGHGGVDPGNPGMFFPRGITESDVNLAIAKLLRNELEERGVGVVMTRDRDTLIDLRDRGRFCSDTCDLFVSIHMNSLPRRTGFTRVRGFETYFLAEAKTEDAARVSRMENEAIRFESPDDEAEQAGGLEFILRDLQLNEYLRESARAAELVQSYLKESHTGPDRGVKQGGLVVLTTARRPAILVELGYSTNSDDAKVLTNRSSQKNLASSLADAIVAYLREYERKVATPPSADAGGRTGNR